MSCFVAESWGTNDRGRLIGRRGRAMSYYWGLTLAYTPLSTSEMCPANTGFWWVRVLSYAFLSMGAVRYGSR